MDDCLKTIFARNAKTVKRAYVRVYESNGTINYTRYQTAGERDDWGAQRFYEDFDKWDELAPETLYYINVRPKGTDAGLRHLGIPFRHRLCVKPYEAHVRAYHRHLDELAEQLRLQASEDENRRTAALYWARLNDLDYSSHLRTRIEYEHAKRWGYLGLWMERHDGRGTIPARPDEKRRKNPWETG